jgi:hypothetical protein
MKIRNILLLNSFLSIPIIFSSENNLSSNDLNLNEKKNFYHEEFKNLNLKCREIIENYLENHAINVYGAYLEEKIQGVFTLR